MSKLFLAITVCAAVMTVASTSVNQAPARPATTRMLIADGPLPPPDPPDPPCQRSIEV